MTLLSSVRQDMALPAFRGEWRRKTNASLFIPGAPFDTGTSYRPGARFGPSGIRQGSRRLNL